MANNKTFIAIIISIAISVFFSGCFEKPKPKQEVKPKVFQKEDEYIFSRIENLAKGRKPSKKKLIEEKMLKKDPVFAKKKEKKALIINKKSDEIVRKPLYLEPLFTRVEIMPYVTKDGLYHEQESIWVKIKDGEIVIKANKKGSTTTDSFKSILNK